MNKKYFLFIIIFLCVFSIAYAKDTDFSGLIFKELDFPVHPSMEKPNNYGTTFNYIVNENCIDCLVSFFETELKKRGWTINEVKMEGTALDSLMQLKNKVTEAKKKNLSSDVDPRLQEYLLSSKSSTLVDMVKKASPMLIKASLPGEGLFCDIAINSVQSENAFSGLPAGPNEQRGTFISISIFTRNNIVPVQAPQNSPVMR